MIGWQHVVVIVLIVLATAYLAYKMFLRKRDDGCNCDGCPSQRECASKNDPKDCGDCEKKE